MRKPIGSALYAVTLSDVYTVTLSEMLVSPVHSHTLRDVGQHSTQSHSQTCWCYQFCVQPLLLQPLPLQVLGEAGQPLVGSLSPALLLVIAGLDL